MKKTILFIVQGLLCLNFAAGAQDITALQPGDKIPEALWKQPLKSRLGKDKTAIISLDQFKGKFIIIDFWGSHCVPCIKFLPKLDSLGRQFEDKLAVLPVSDYTDSKDLDAAFKRYHLDFGPNSPNLFADPALSAYFPHQLVSHLVWIDESGTVIATTGSEYVTESNIKLAFNGVRNFMPNKTDFDFKYQRPLLSFNHEGISSPKPIFYSTVTGSIPGISPPMGTIRDTIAGTATTSFYNVHLLGLAQLALQYRTGASREDFLMQVADESRYYIPPGEYFDAWSKKNTYCFSLSVPIHFSDLQIQQMVMAEMVRWLAVMGIQISITDSGKISIREAAPTHSSF